MYYELYIDSLFVVNFVMNLYLLMLVNYTVGRTATRLRLTGSAAFGALVYCGSFLTPYLPVWIKMLIATVAVSVAMVCIAFRPVDAATCFRLIERMVFASFALGGGIIFLMNQAGILYAGITGMAGVLGVGTLLYFLISFFRKRERHHREEICKTTLVREGTRVTVKSLLDTGNGLVEPISGKPVSVADKKIVESLWPEGLPKAFRAIPYHSIGNRGIMKGYELPEMIVEYGGIRYIFHHVYLGVSEEAVTSLGNYGMILHPGLLDRKEKG